MCELVKITTIISQKANFETLGKIFSGAPCKSIHDGGLVVSAQ